MNDELHDREPGGMYRPAPDLLMGPITGLRPTDGRWGGEMPEEYMMAIYTDLMENDIPAMMEKIEDDIPLPDLLGMVVLQTVTRTGQRLAVELDGCTIDTTTIFDDEPL